MNKEEMRQKLGNIAQIRELLFGEQIEEYERKFIQTQRKTQIIEAKLEDLSLDLDSLKSNIQEQLLEIKESLTEEINAAVDSLDKKLKYLSINTYTEVTKLNKDIDNKTQSNFQKIELVTDRINSHLKAFKEETKHNQTVLVTDIENLKKQLSETIEKNLADLTEAKVSRHDLAEMFFELCLKVKQQDATNAEIEPNLDNGSQEEKNGELLLLEEKTNQ